MQIYLLSIGEQMPAWIQTGFDEYANRLPQSLSLNLIQIPKPKGSKKSKDKQIQQKQETQALLKKAQNSNLRIALDASGKSINTAYFSEQIKHWHDQHLKVSFLIGGSTGLHSSCFEQTHAVWSLSDLTFPHMLVRVIMAEQIYRAWSFITHHPYYK